RGFTNFVGESARAADAMNALHNRAEVIFGHDFLLMEQRATDLGHEFGRSGTQMLDFETQLTAVGTGLGITQTAAEGMSVKMTALAVDIGKVFQESDDQALQRLG